MCRLRRVRRLQKFVAIHASAHTHFNQKNISTSDQIFSRTKPLQRPSGTSFVLQRSVHIAANQRWLKFV